MSEQPDEDREPAPVVEKAQDPQPKWGTQTMGAVLGGIMGLLLAFLLRRLGWGGENTLRFVLGGGVAGAMVAGVDSLERAGRRLTRRDEPWLNIVVAVVGMAIIFAVIFGLSYAFALLMRQFTGG